MDQTATSIETIRERLPDTARDLRINLGNVLTADGTPALTDAQRWGVAVTAAAAAREPGLGNAIREQARSAGVEEAVIAGAESAAAIMAMNNVYYRFTHLVGDPGYRSMPARLRMGVIGKPGIPAADFELFALVASAINGCGACMDSHERELRKRDVTAEAVQDAVRIAAVVNAVAATRANHPHL